MRILAHGDGGFASGPVSLRANDTGFGTNGGGRIDGTGAQAGSF